MQMEEEKTRMLQCGNDVVETPKWKISQLLEFEKAWYACHYYGAREPPKAPEWYIGMYIQYKNWKVRKIKENMFLLIIVGTPVNRYNGFAQKTIRWAEPVWVRIKSPTSLMAQLT